MQQILNVISGCAVPVMILIIVTAGFLRLRGSVFSHFTSGAASGLKTVLNIAPSIIGLVTAIEMFKASGALDVLNSTLSPIMNALGIPPELSALILLRPISGSGALSLLDRTLASYGADSSIGRCACVMCGSSETTVYTLTLYFGSVRIRRTRYSLIAAVLADFVGIFAAVWITSVLF